ncbi:hypothetical protein GC176_06260 [bacterium]|nr:hypothetical protein [bacterium]
MQSGRVDRQPNSGLFCIWAIAAAFCTYFCMYAFRKPFTAGEYGGITLGGIDYKTVLVVAQVLGYTVSKFIGIKVVSEISPGRRGIAIAGLIGSAEVALVVFAVVPAPWNFAALFFNGLPLGMVFGLVLSYLEGRRLTEALSAGLCASFILSSGVVKSVGRSLVLDYHVNEYWMPALTGLIFAPPLALSIWMLTRIPPPDAVDVEHRAERKPLTRIDRWAFFMKYSVGLSLLLGIYIVLTVLRSVRDDFAVEIWTSLGVSKQPEVFAQTEMLVMFAVTALNAAAILIARNRTAFLTALVLVGSGFALVALASLLQSSGVLGPFAFMVLSGIGLYVPYVAFHTTVFERLIAATRDKANLGFLMYLADSTGYLGYVAVMLASTYGLKRLDMLDFFHTLAYVVAASSIVAVTVALLWFRRKIPSSHAVSPVVAPEGATP